MFLVLPSAIHPTLDVFGVPAIVRSYCLTFIPRTRMVGMRRMHGRSRGAVNTVLAASLLPRQIVKSILS